ncbi:unnamed protein product [Cylicocyclus nassatus]|uniref:Uncharacterized protein n=1 Tax=Cylicocyclus nassatus TaxID=53992 RepID=A0AA36DLS7_CYLNA|nr:unnamed protein product [Cylicocyclus nassatus]
MTAPFGPNVLDPMCGSSHMAAEHESKPLYFANGDFAKTVADIIASSVPESDRGKAYASQDAIYEISEKQRDYYTKCFRHLMRTTQGNACLEGALNGADMRIIEFFKRSGLDNEVLSKIWSLSDVNEDGWLDINEFSAAMHLIVLKVKGHVEIPLSLPSCIRPPMTPPRASSQVQNSPVATASALRGPPSSGSWDQFDAVDFAPPSSANNLKKETPLAEFSDIPPLLVDSRPTAVKQTVPAVPLLALKSPSGPPPQPPPRPLQKGHIRSASLDMMKQLQLAQTGYNALVQGCTKRAQQFLSPPLRSSLMSALVGGALFWRLYLTARRVLNHAILPLPQSSTFVRALDGNPPPTKIEQKLARHAARAADPSILPGVRPIPKEVSDSLRDQLTPGKYYAKSMTQYLGPFDDEPTAETLPSGDTYFILQNMGRLGDTGKCVFRHVKQINVTVLCKVNELVRHSAGNGSYAIGKYDFPKSNSN